jgi:argininosuccinate lyase
MRLRESVLSLAEAALVLRHTLLDTASAHRDDGYPAHTHTQPAQPTTLAHYLLAVVEQLERDTERLFAAYETTNRNPLGALRDYRHRFSDRSRAHGELLGFAGPTGNTYGSIATVDYLLESAGCGGDAHHGLGRVVQDLLLWCTQDLDTCGSSDGFVQRSSIMPQKRNPVALEHARARRPRRSAHCRTADGRPQHAVRRHRGHRRRSAAARRHGVWRCRARRWRSWPPPSLARRSTRPHARTRIGRRRRHDRAGRSARP